MPVRFRCSYCNQLLGISRRKIGTAIKCPTCQGQVIVPPRDADDRPRERIEQIPMDPPGSASTERNFEGLELDLMFAPPSGSAAPVPARLPTAAAESALPDLDIEVDVERLPVLPAPQAGFVLTPIRLILLTAATILALALAFGGGLLVGKNMSAASRPAASADE
jgi:DNA-directed RNA polymerase subunit RPC12/RpoP